MTVNFQAEGTKQQPVTGGGHSGGQETSLRASRIIVCREPGTDHQEGAEPCCDIDIHHDNFLYTPHAEVHLILIEETHTLSARYLLES